MKNNLFKYTNNSNKNLSLNRYSMKKSNNSIIQHNKSFN